MKLFLSILFLCFISCSTTIDQGTTTVYITSTGSKYHDISCTYLGKSKIPMAVKEAVNRGYTPCSICNPVKFRIQPEPQDSLTSTPSENLQKSQQSAKQLVQCSAITQKGTRCKRMTSKASGKCFQHDQ